MGCTQKAFDYRNRYDEDGMMIGRAVIGYPWIFGEIKHFFATGELLAPLSTRASGSCSQTLQRG